MPFALLSQTSRADDKKAVRAAVADALTDPDVTRLVVEPRVAERFAPTVAHENDIFLSQVLAALMVTERLDVEIAYVSAEATPATSQAPPGPRASNGAPLAPRVAAQPWASSGRPPAPRAKPSARQPVSASRASGRSCW